MKELTSFLREGLTTRYDVKDIDIEEFKRIAEKTGNDKDGLGAAVAESKSKIVNSILGKMFNKTPWSVELQFKSWCTTPPSHPIYDDEIEKILFDNFNFFKTSETLYLAPKKTPKAAVKRWLSDDFRGTMENPNW
jgi:hypothetical protein